MNQEETVFQYIKKAIVENRLPPGTRLRELQLASIFGVKRGLIRKVLARLTHARLVDHQPNIGAQVAIPSLQDAEDLFATRQILERATIKNLACNLDTEKIQILRKHLQKEQHAYQSGNHKLGVRLSVDFHNQLAHLAGNRIIAEFLSEIINRTPLIMMHQSGQATNGCINHQHGDILDALIEQDTDKAISLMQEHLEHLQRMFNHPEPQPAPPDLAEIFNE